MTQLNEFDAFREAARQERRLRQLEEQNGEEQTKPPDDGGCACCFGLLIALFFYANKKWEDKHLGRDGDKPTPPPTAAKARTLKHKRGAA